MHVFFQNISILFRLWSPRVVKQQGKGLCKHAHTLKRWMQFRSTWINEQPSCKPWTMLAAELQLSSFLHGLVMAAWAGWTRLSQAAVWDWDLYKHKLFLPVHWLQTASVCCSTWTLTLCFNLLNVLKISGSEDAAVQQQLVLFLNAGLNSLD